jgi:hypothetical protein
VSSPIPPPAKGDPDEFVKGLESDVAEFERREQEGESLSDEDRAALIGGRSWLVMHRFAATVAPEKIETVYSSERDRRLSQATARVVRREQTRRPAPRSSAIITPRRRASHRTRPRRRTSSSSATSSADPGDSDPAGPPAAPRWRRFTVDDHYVVVAVVA